MISSQEKIQHLPKKNASFTLIELLVVVAILALLMGIVVISLNPTEMLKKGRDSKRISELKSINTALGIFQANKPTTSMGNASTTYVSIPAINSNCSDLGLPTLTGYTYSCSTSTANYKKTDGTGWIPVNFNSLDIGSPLFTLPIDPTNTTSTGLYYTYTTGGSWELTSTFESQNFRFYGDSDKVSTDGGDSYSLYEVGNDLTLNPIKDSGLVGYWKMDGGTSGSIANNQTQGLEDASGNSNNGTASNANGTGMAWTQGKTGGAVSFDGVDDIVRVPDSDLFDPSPGTLTISFWTKLNQLPVDAGHTYTFASHFHNASPWNSWTVGTYLNVVNFTVKNAVGDLINSTSKSSFVVDNWYHVVAVSSGVGNPLKIYLNGVDNTGWTSGNFTGTLMNANSHIYIGNSYGGGPNVVKGLIDEVRIYNRALSAAEISAIYNASR